MSESLSETARRVANTKSVSAILKTSGQVDIWRLEAQIKSLTDRLLYKGSLHKRERFAKRIRAKTAKLVTLKMEQ